MATPVTLFQHEIAVLLGDRYSTQDAEIRQEWRAFANTSGVYSPRVDIAVGPFSVTRGGNRVVEYDALLDYSSRFVQRLIHHHTENVNRYRQTDEPRIDDALRLPTLESLTTYNRNARCFMAIEIENAVSRKHLLGGAVNACALGRVGVVIGWDERKVKALIKLQAYWDFLRNVGKNTFGTDNLLILGPEQLRDAIEGFQP